MSVAIQLNVYKSFVGALAMTDSDSYANFEKKKKRRQNDTKRFWASTVHRQVVICILNHSCILTIGLDMNSNNNKETEE